MTPKQLLTYYGGRKATYEKLGITKQALSLWEKGGIPPFRQCQIEILTGGKLKADLPKTLRKHAA